MNPEEARQLILWEGYPANDHLDALYIRFHFHDIPDRGRVKQLIIAINAIHETLKGLTVLDRQLAGALWVLGDTVNEFLNVPIQSEKNRELFDDLMSLHTAIESVFLDL